MPPRSNLSIRLVLASIFSAAAVAVVCGVALFSLSDVSRFTGTVVARHMALLNDTSAFEAVLYHRGFAAEYMLTGDRALLLTLDRSRAAFASWLERARAQARSPEARRVLAEIERGFAEYHSTRRRAIGLFDRGDRAQAHSVLLATHAHIERVLKSFGAFNALGREQAEATLADADRSTRQLGWLIVGTSLLAVLASLAAGIFLAQRVARPIYELQLQVASAAERMRIEVRPQRDLDSLSSDVAALVRRLEDMDATLVEQRRRLIQSEKLSAVGEIAAKLAHEVLNPLTGMKAAAQVLARSAQSGTVEITAVRETAEALDREIGRVTDLVRRLVDYSRPLAPRLEPVPVARVLDDAMDAAQLELERRRATVQREEEPGLPCLEVDPLLVTQVLCNLLCNGAQAMAGPGQITLTARHSPALGRDGVLVEILDEGSGLAPGLEGKLFHPFVTTKPNGHGLGLAICHNIVLEHGGRISARNRGDRSGASFEVWLPAARQA